MGGDVFGFLPAHFAIRRSLGFPQDFFPDREVPPLLSSEISLNESAIGAAKVIELVRQILADVNLPVRVGDLVDDLHHIPILPRSSPSPPF